MSKRRRARRFEVSTENELPADGCLNSLSAGTIRKPPIAFHEFLGRGKSGKSAGKG